MIERIRLHASGWETSASASQHRSSDPNKSNRDKRGPNHGQRFTRTRARAGRERRRCSKSRRAPSASSGLHQAAAEKMAGQAHFRQARAFLQALRLLGSSGEASAGPPGQGFEDTAVAVLSMSKAAHTIVDDSKGTEMLSRRLSGDPSTRHPSTPIPWSHARSLARTHTHTQNHPNRRAIGGARRASPPHRCRGPPAAPQTPAPAPPPPAQARPYGELFQLSLRRRRKSSGDNCVCVCMCVCTRTRMCVRAFVRSCVCACGFLCRKLCVCACLRVCVCACVLVCVYVCVRV